MPLDCFTDSESRRVLHGLGILESRVKWHKRASGSGSDMVSDSDSNTGMAAAMPLGHWAGPALPARPGTVPCQWRPVTVTARPLSARARPGRVQGGPGRRSGSRRTRSLAAIGVEPRTRSLSSNSDS